MIKINLLPTKKTRKTLGVKQELLVNGFLLILIMIVLGVLWTWQNKDVARLETQKAEKTQQLDKLKKVVAEVEQFKKDKELYEQKIQIINDLEAQQSGPVHIIDELSLNIPDKLWYETLTLKGSTLTISGSAFANIAIVDLINNMKRSPYFQNVQLIESKLSTKKDSRVYIYKLSANVTMPKQ
jgi:type IV pilus assembly protein PilN